MDNHTRLTTSAATIAIAAAASFFPVSAYAQNAGQTTAQQAAPNNSIIVTARKQEETLLEAPVAITAFAEEDIEDLGLVTIEDIQLFTPGFVFEAFATVPGRFDQSPRFRGIDIDTGDPFRQTASVFIDGIYVINGASGIALNDVARVEVVKGPQSAVYGRNTFGGAVNYISKVPGNDFAVDASISAATRDDYEFSAGMDIPLVEDVLAARVSGFYRDKRGHYLNTFDANNIVTVNPFSTATYPFGINDNFFIGAGTGTTGEYLGDQQTWNVSGSLYFTPGDRLSVKLRAAYFENSDGPPAVGEIRFTQANCGASIANEFQALFPAGATRRFYCGPIDPDSLLPIGAEIDAPAGIEQSVINSTPLNGPRDTFGLDRQNLTLSGQFDFDLTDDLMLSGLFGYIAEDVSLLNDSDATPVRTRFFGATSDRQFRMNSQELRLSGSVLDDFIDFSIGGSHFWQEFRNAGGFISFRNGAFDLRPVDPIARELVETLGVFGSIAFNITDNLTLTGEGRYQEDEVTINADETTPIDNQATFKNFLPRVILDWQVNPDTLFYLSYSEGNNPGGFNDEVIALSQTEFETLQAFDPAVERTFAEEKLTNYEFGAKHAFANGRGNLAVALFFMERAGQQFRTSNNVAGVNNGETVTYFLNRGETDIKGFEIEGNYALNDIVTLFGSVGFVDAEFQVVTDTIYNNYFGSFDAAGQKAPRYPKWSGSFSVLAETELPSGLPVYARVDNSYIGRRFADISNLSYTNAGVITNLRVGVEPDPFRVEFFVRNLGNSDVPTGVGRTSDFASLFFGQYSYRIGLRDKRQFGIRASVDW